MGYSIPADHHRSTPQDRFDGRNGDSYQSRSMAENPAQMPRGPIGDTLDDALYAHAVAQRKYYSSLRAVGFAHKEAMTLLAASPVPW